MAAFPLRFFGLGLLVDSRGQAVAVRSRRQLALLAFLAIEHQSAHSRERLAALLWPDETHTRAHNNLRVTLSRLRDLGEQLAALDMPPAELLLVSRTTVRLSPAWAARADINSFTLLAEQTQRHAHASRGQCAACQADLSAAVQLYQGELLADFHLDDCPAFDEWLTLQRERIRLLLLGAYDDLAIYAEAQGDLVVARDFAQRQIELDPLRESAYRRQMRVLARQGERSAALLCFERCRARLHDELGIDPEPETLALHMQILGGAAAASQPNVSMAARYGLPQPLNLFVGREEELAQLHSRLTEPTSRLISIVGPGGIGKSRLALQLATRAQHMFRDGVAFAALAQIPSGDSIPAAIAEALGIDFAVSQKSPFEQLIEMVGHKQLLLVLDNFEHLTDASHLLMQLLQHAPHVVLLVTSRERLNLQAEDLFELEGLPAPASSADATAGTFAAVRLFVDRASRLDKRFAAPAAELPQIVRICQMVEGFPLAIELAASWVREWSCTQIVAELTGGLGRLETTLRDIAPHHRSLRAVFDTSWRLLTQAERLALQQLTIFHGGFTPDAARAVADTSPALLRGLRDKSLLRQATAQRYDMHTLVQQFAAEALAQEPHAELHARRRHSQFFLTLLAQRAIDLDTRSARAAADLIQPDWENVSAAWRQASTAGEHQLMHAALDGLVRFCDLRGLFQEAQALLERSIARCETPRRDAEAAYDPADGAAALQLRQLTCRLLTALAYFAGRRGQSDTLALAQQALELATQLNSRDAMIANLVTQANVYELLADYAQGRALAEQALGMAEAEGLEEQAAVCLDSLGIIELLSGNYTRAGDVFQRVLAIHQRTGRCEQRARVALGRLGSVATELGRYDLALRYTEEYLDSCERMDDRRNVGHAQHHLAFLWLRLGSFGRVITLESQSIARSRALGDRELTSLSLHNKSHAHRALGQLTEALSCAAEAVELAHAIDARLALAYALGKLAEAQMAGAEHEQDWAEAAVNFWGAAASFRAFGKLVMAYEAEIGLAELALRRGDLASARRQILPIIPHLPTAAADGWDEPLRAYVICARILLALHDPAAQRIVDQGIRLLDGLALNISDLRLRQSFLQAVPAHRELRALHVAAADE